MSQINKEVDVAIKIVQTFTDRHEVQLDVSYIHINETYVRNSYLVLLKFDACRSMISHMLNIQRRVDH